MILTTPIPFRDAVTMHARRGVMPTSLRSADLQRLDASILRASFFSSQTTQRWLLDGYKSRIQALIDPQRVQRPDRVTPENPQGYVTEGLSEAELRTQIKELLASMDYQPAASKAGTIQDLSSNQRIELVIRTNAEMAQSHGYWEQGQARELLDAFPAQELVRVEDRNDKRTWVQRWRAAGGTVYPGKSPGLPLEPGFSEGRLIARKDSPVWASINRFGNPYPPFDFNSGVGVEDVSYDEAVKLGVMKPGDIVAPMRVEFGASLGQQEVAA